MVRLARTALVGACLAVLQAAGFNSSSLVTGIAWAQGTGRSLDIQPGARQNAMGAAGVALVGDPCDALWWNPAALGFTRSVSGQLTYAMLVSGLADDVSYSHGAAAVPIGSLGGVGYGRTRLDYSSSEGTDSEGRQPEFFNSFETTNAVGAGIQVLPDLSVGATLKWIRIQLAPEALSGVGKTWGVDAGALYRVPTDLMRLSWGVNVQNVGPSVTFLNEDQASPLSRNLKLGAAASRASPLGDYWEVGWTAVLDFNQSLVTGEFRTWHGGAEGYVGHSNLVRLAWRSGYYHDHLGEIGDWTYGFGARVGGLTVDASWIPQARNSDLERVRKVTGGFQFDLWSP